MLEIFSSKQLLTFCKVLMFQGTCFREHLDKEKKSEMHKNV